MKTFLFAFIALALLGCATGSVSEGVCDTKTVSWSVPNLPTIPVSLSKSGCGSQTFMVPNVESAPFTEDFSKTLSDISDVVSTLTVSVDSLTLDNSNGDFNWVSGVTVDIEGAVSMTPRTTLATYTMTGPVSTINLNVVMDSNTLQLYMESGPVQLWVTLDGGTIDCSTLQTLANTNGHLDSKMGLCLTVSGSDTASVP